MMTDVLTKEQRSRNMAAIKSSGNKTTERLFQKLLRTQKISGWRRNDKRLSGSPDFVFYNRKVAIFIDGDFWHGYNMRVLGKKLPNAFWKKKILANIDRDKRVT